MIKQRFSRTECCLAWGLGGVMFLTAVAILVMSLFHAIDRQVEIDESKPSDYCRAHPQACDMPVR